MTNDVPILPAKLTVAEARSALLEQLKGPDFVYYIYIVDDLESRGLRGVITMRHLLIARDDQRVEELMRTDMETIHALEPAVTAAHRVVDNHLAALPVVGKDGRLLGGVTADSAIALIAPASWRQQAPRVFS
jgi:magnesium transporter